MNFASVNRLTRSAGLFLAFLPWVLGFVGPEYIYADEERGPVDWIVLVDTSQSMIGRGAGAQNIFNEVKSTIREFIAKNVQLGDSVRIYRFDEDVALIDDTSVVSAETRRRAAGAVDRLAATGLYTHTGEAIRSALDRADELKKLGAMENTSRQPVIMLLTDGLEDIRPGSKARSLATLRLGTREVKPYLFVVWLGGRQGLRGTPLERAVQDNFGERGKILEHPEGRDMQRIIDQIREAIRPPVFLRPQHVDFGRVENGEESKSQQLTIESSRSTSVRFSLLAAYSRNVTVVAPSLPVFLQKGKNSVPLKIKVNKEAAAGIIDGQLAVGWDEIILRDPHAIVPGIEGRSNPEAVLSFRVTVFRRTLLEKILATTAWVVPILALVLTVAAWISFWHGFSLNDMLKRFRDNRQLSGSLELEDEAFDLKTEGKSVVNLSDIFKDRMKMDESDAQLSVTSQGGRVRIRLRRLRGNVKLNDTPLIGHSLLENGDTVQVGNLLFTFRDN